MLQRVALVAILSAGLLAGCFGGKDDSTGTTNGGLLTGADQLFAGPALWLDPQDTPHPKWNWPTLANPPVGPNVPSYWQPIAMKPLPGHIAGLSLVSNVGPAQGITAGAGIAVFGSLAVVPSDGWNGAEGGVVVDVSDPTHPQALGTMDTVGRGATIIAYPDGRLVSAISTSGGFDVVEITDPMHPTLLSSAEPSEGGHKIGLVPGTPIIYNAGSSGGENTVPLLGPGPCNVSIDRCTGYTSIYNLTDPSDPVLVQEWHNGLACHHIFFYNAPDGSKQRGICAGIQYTQLWDTTDPENPTVIVSVPVHYGYGDGPSTSVSIAAFSHTAGLSIDGTILYVGDENMGGGAPPGCGAGSAVPGVGEAGTPVGATWFYDVTTETEPRLLGYFAPPRDVNHQVTRTGAPGNLGSCTTHHGRLVPDPEGRDLLAMSYYNDGVIVLDFTPTGPEGASVIEPKIVGEFHDGSDTWETWYYGGYLFVGDLQRGLDILTFG
ncbi:MAG: hypothetical protein QOJ26_1525 [Thermoplasmata archaeon]|nr:hypothetical protein [Thermoplasmata archaeon]